MKTAYKTLLSSLALAGIVVSVNAYATEIKPIGLSYGASFTRGANTDEAKPLTATIHISVLQPERRDIYKNVTLIPAGQKTGNYVEIVNGQDVTNGSIKVFGWKLEPINSKPAPNCSFGTFSAESNLGDHLAKITISYDGGGNKTHGVYSCASNVAQ